MEPQYDAITAYHEAGHAVVALALGRPVQRVSVLPDRVHLGQCEFRKGEFRPTAATSAQEAVAGGAVVLIAVPGVPTLNGSVVIDQPRNVYWRSVLRPRSVDNGESTAQPTAFPSPLTVFVMGSLFSENPEKVPSMSVTGDDDEPMPALGR